MGVMKINSELFDNVEVDDDDHHYDDNDEL